jgi:hypothetical protein
MHGNLKEGTGRGSHLSLVMPSSRAERLRWWVVTLLPVVPVVVVATVAIAAVWDHPTKRLSGFGFGNLELALQSMQSGGTTANAAATVAASQPPGSLSASALNTALPTYEWVEGPTNVPYSSKRPIVGVSTSGTHIETAVRTMAGSCSYGLSIASASDPLITEDHLLGAGTYFQYVYDAPQCAADQAPTSSWTAWLGTS